MIIAGVDGGGTKTEAICCDQTGRIVGRGSSGTSNYHNVGLDTAIKHVEAALANAGFPKPDVLCVALAAMNTSADFQVLNGRLQQIHPGAMLEHDAFAELYLGTRGKPGVLVIAGTGSVVLGYDGKERHRRCDLGWFLGDDGSGYYIGKEGLRTAARMIFEEGEETQITKEVLNHLGLKNPEEIMEWAYSQKNTVTSVAGVASAVKRAALAGDRIAISIYNKASSYLAGNALEMALKLKVKTVYVKGGIFNTPLFLSNFSEILSKKGISTVSLNGFHAMGSLLIAADSVGVRVIEE